MAMNADNPTYVKLVDALNRLLQDDGGYKVTLAWGEPEDIIDALWPEIQRLQIEAWPEECPFDCDHCRV